jgi:hypothetical protein
MMARPASIDAFLRCIGGTLPSEEEWESVIALANQSMTIGTLAECVRQNRNWHQVPENVRHFLSAIYVRAVQRNKQLDTQLAETIACLNQGGIHPILLKGAALRFTPGAAGGEGRLLTDLDLMVPASASLRATECLRQIGYRFYTHPVAEGDTEVLIRDRDAGMLDLHVQLKGSRPSINADELARDCVPIQVMGAHAMLPSATSQALILIVHDQLQDRDYWRGLIDMRHLLDLDGLAKSDMGVDWEKLASRFPQGYPLRALQAQLVTANRLLNTKVPSQFVGGRRARLQHLRRTFQTRRPFFRLPMTMISLALDPPPLEILSRGSSFAARPTPRSWQTRFMMLAWGLRCMLRPKAIGKL